MILNSPIVLATGNSGKLSEFKKLLPNATLIPQTNLQIPDVEETGLSFIENAILKARHASQMANLPALADDSGLVVKALQGAPGIYSARFAGPKATSETNIDLLLEKLSDVFNERDAYFYCAIALVEHANDPTPVIATGRLKGWITHERQGSHGFGYDPVFYLNDYQCTLAQLSAETKNTLSHRAIALKALQKQLEFIYE